MTGSNQHTHNKNLKKKNINGKTIIVILGIILLVGVVIAVAYGMNQTHQINSIVDSSSTNDPSQNNTTEVVLGEETTNEQGETVVLTQDENGNIVTTIVKDKNGNSTGNVIPENHGGNSAVVTNSGSSNNNGTSGGSVVPSPAPAGHTHSWQPHYATRTVEHTTAVYVVDSPATPAEGHWVSHEYCNICGQIVDNDYSCSHPCMGGAYPSHQASQYVVTKQAQPEKGHYQNVTTTSQEQYIDYYVCSCGATQ